MNGLSFDGAPVLYFIALYLLCGWPLKILGVRRQAAVPLATGAFFWLAPFYSPRTWARRRRLQAADGRRLLRRTAWLMPLTGAVIAAYMAYGGQFGPWGRAYLALLPFYLLTETMGLLLQLLFAVAGVMLPDVHRTPLKAVDLADFWGRRWNRWVGDWLRDVVFGPWRRRPLWGLWATFAVSGLWHEVILHGPLWLSSGRGWPGSMLLYFVLQAAGMQLERAVDRRWPLPMLLKRVWMAIVVVGPAPLLANEAFRQVFLFGT